MSIMLPDELVWVLDLLGYDWPNLDEDKLFACAQAWRDFANDIAEAESDGSSAANAVVSANSGEAIEKFSESWESSPEGSATTATWWTRAWPPR